ncbi:MAG: methyltransferase domain-containing protein [Sphingomicrobium sp.]
MSILFDHVLRARRRDRAARVGPELFLLERAFADCLERLAIIGTPWKSAFLLGCPDPEWKNRLGTVAGAVAVADPGPAFARAADGATMIEDEWTPPDRQYDLILAMGTLDTVNDLPKALRALASGLQPGGLIIGALSGGDTLPLLRSAMAAADRIAGQAAPHVHPRVEASALAPLLQQAGLVRPVVDVDRVSVSYTSLRRLIADLRAMGATNLLDQRSRHYLGKAALAEAGADFASSASDGRSTETFEVLHFAAWKPER